MIVRDKGNYIGGPSAEHTAVYGKRYGLKFGFNRLVPLSDVVVANDSLIEALRKKANHDLHGHADKALTIGLVVGSLLQLLIKHCFATNESKLLCMRGVNWAIGWYAMLQSGVETAEKVGRGRL